MISNKLQTYKNLKVLVTGSTGFKGAWLCFCLHLLNARVIGIALKPEKNSLLFKKLLLSNKIKQIYLDIKYFKKLNQIVKKEKPDIIFHLAAQSVVSESYINPINTITTNVIGSSNILETVRINKIKNLVYTTSDKCYLNDGRKTSYSENDILGGEDLYSASKACAELTFEAILDYHGTVNVEVTATDGLYYESTDFDVTVSRVNDRPEINAITDTIYTIVEDISDDSNSGVAVSDFIDDFSYDDVDLFDLDPIEPRGIIITSNTSESDQGTLKYYSNGLKLSGLHMQLGVHHS